MNLNSSQTQFNWKQLSPVDFENLVFFLLDDMGFKNLEWRKGGEGISSTDGGRDLEATFTRFEPGDIVTLEKWWIEVKYRSSNLASTAIKESVLNATGRDGVDVFAIVTTGTISNKTWDWIKEFQSTQPKPRIRVWQRHDLERILRKYPQTTSRFFATCLTLPERVKAVEDRFWNSVALPTLDEINETWKEFSNLQWTGSNFIPFVIAEASAGYPEFRQWGINAAGELLMEALAVGLANVPQLIVRFKQYGRSSTPLVTGLAYLLEMALLRVELDSMLNIVTNPYQVMGGEIEPTSDLLSFIWEPVLSHLYFDLGINCSQDCSKVSWGDSEKHLSISFFDRFVKRDGEKMPEGEEPYVVIQLSDFECTIDVVPNGEHCPLSDDIPENCGNELNLRNLLCFAQQVIRSRAAYTGERR